NWGQRRRSQINESRLSPQLAWPLLHELDELRGRQRLADPVALEAVASAHVEEVELRASADTFCDDLQTEATREADDRLGDRRVALVGLEVGDERDVDLQRVDREVLQVR